MAKHTIEAEGFAPFEVEEGTKLVLALEENGVDVSHRCGGNARCTTCRVEIQNEEPPMGDAEKECLVEDGVLGEFRLSCQIRVQQDFKVKVLKRASDMGWEPGPTPEP